MRYEDWDILLFPAAVPPGKRGQTPLKEFRVACHVVPDTELYHSRSSHGLPVMTCFTPALKAGTPFQISIHNWNEAPGISEFTKQYSKHPELAKFEARILVDGRLVALISFKQGKSDDWPHVIANTFRFTKDGEFEALGFPSFRQEVLFQSHWNPGDHMGRIKIIISEGFPRDSQSAPMERVKNVVAFSFQHAPIEILEHNGVAWPNPQMWHRPGGLHNVAGLVPSFQSQDGADSHSHSPRRRSRPPAETGKVSLLPVTTSIGPLQNDLFTSNLVFGGNCNLFQQPTIGPESMFSGAGVAERTDDTSWFDPLGELAGQYSQNSLWPFPRNISKQSSSDESMPDFASTMVERNISHDPMHLSGGSLDEKSGMSHPKVPTNTPTTRDYSGMSAAMFNAPCSTVPGDLAYSVAESLLNQPPPMLPPHQIPLPASEIKSRKENRRLNSAPSRPSPASVASPSLAQTDTRKTSRPSFALAGPSHEINHPSSTEHTVRDSPVNQPVLSASVSRSTSHSEFGNIITNRSYPSPAAGLATLGQGLSSAGSENSLKRSRTFTPASNKAIDEEDEPRRVSPHLRHLSKGSNQTQEN